MEINYQYDDIDKIYKYIEIKEKKLKQIESWKGLLGIIIIYLILFPSIIAIFEVIFGTKLLESFYPIIFAIYMIGFLIVPSIKPYLIKKEIRIAKNKVSKILDEREEQLPELISELENNIINFEPLNNYKNELGYHIDLARYLKERYNNLLIESQVNYNRPDIVIDNIAIEIKGPTRMSDLKTIPDKINSYLKNWDYLVIVLFDINIISYNENKNREIYENKKREIIDNLIDTNKQRVLFIEI